MDANKKDQLKNSAISFGVSFILMYGLMKFGNKTSNTKAVALAAASGSLSIILGILLKKSAEKLNQLQPKKK